MWPTGSHFSDRAYLDPALGLCLISLFTRHRKQSNFESGLSSIVLSPCERDTLVHLAFAWAEIANITPI